MNKKKIIEILKEGKIELFNRWRRIYNIEYLDLSGANLYHANLRHADLCYAKLSDTNLSCANLYHANLRHADLCYADLSDANLSCANLRHANLSCANLSCANLSRIKINYNPIDYLNKNFEKTNEGYIVYKTFSEYYPKPNYWSIKENIIIEEIGINTNLSNKCGSGINVATLDWVLKETNEQIWKCLIKFEWACSIFVPYDTDGKIRCSKLQILEKVERI